jgi:hypothetical protein
MRTAGSRLTRVFVATALVAVFSAVLIHPFPCPGASEKWQGVDESVIEKHAREHGRESRGPLINTDQGDLLLVVFLLAGVLGGFAAGYYWRTLLDQRKTFRGETKNAP